jgi:hypothetical protein
MSSDHTQAMPCVEIWMALVCADMQVSNESGSGEIKAKRLQLSNDGASLEAEIDGERLTADLSVHDHADEQVS